MIKHGSLVISLDFEMMWGCHDWATPEGYGESNIRNVRTVISRLQALFEIYSARATFATVGLIFCRDKQEALESYPKSLPIYLNLNVSPFKGSYIKDISDRYKELYFAPEMIEYLNQCKNIEVGSHTFSHYFCWEAGQTVEQFSADVAQMQKVASDRGITIMSIVFPKNQISQEYLEVCSKAGIKTYRGNALKYFNEPKNQWEGIKNRICRILDAYFNVGGYSSIPYSKINEKEYPINITASRFIRPFNQKLSFMEGLRLHRVKKEIEYAAKKGELYHIWWHPHNFGSNMKQNLEFIEEVLKHYHLCHEKYGMESYTMEEMADTLIANQ